MKKKLLALVLIVALAATLLVALTACKKDNDFKVGVILIGDSSEGYTEAHIEGIKAAAASLGLKEDQIIWKEKVEESQACYDAAAELVASGCSLIISNSYGHQDYMTDAAKDFPDATFIAMTGDQAMVSGLANYKNAFNKVYESRYVSGVVAGLKLQELIDDHELTAANYEGGNIRIGYVGAFPYAEVVSGYTAFYLGIKSVVTNVTMRVEYTGEWFHFDKEKETANTLIGLGCVIIGQHADSEGAPTAVEAAYNTGKEVYSVGYNVSMLNAAPNAALTSATNTWSVYYTYAIGAAMRGEEIATDWAEGYNSDAVAITALGSKVAAGTADVVAEKIAAIKAGTLKVFDNSRFTVGGAVVTTAPIDLSYYSFATGSPVLVFEGETKEAIVDGYFSESTLRSAPYFALRIDGISEGTLAD